MARRRPLHRRALHAGDRRRQQQRADTGGAGGAAPERGGAATGSRGGALVGCVARRMETQLQRSPSPPAVYGGKRRGYPRRRPGRILGTAALHTAIPSAPRRAGQPAAGRRHRLAAPEIRRFLALEGRWRPPRLGRNHLSWRRRTQARGTGRADRVSGRSAAGQMGAEQSGARRLGPDWSTASCWRKGNMKPQGPRTVTGHDHCGRNELAAPVKIVEITNVDFSLRHFLLPLMRALRERGHDVVGGCAEGPLLDDVRAEGFRVIALPLVRRLSPLAHIRAFRALVGILRAEKPDIVHAHMPISGFLARLAARAAGVPKVAYTCHGFLFNHQSSSMLRRVASFVMEWTAARV